jgi:hypothetical protein
LDSVFGDKAWANLGLDTRRSHGRAAGTTSRPNAVSPALQRAVATGRMPPLAALELDQLQRTAGNRAVQRLVAGALTVQRETPAATPGAEKTTVKGAGAVGAAGGALPKGSKVDVAPPATTPATDPAAAKDGDDDKPLEFSAEVSGTATAALTGNERGKVRGGSALEVGVEAPTTVALEKKFGPGGGKKFRLLSNPEFKVTLTGGDIDKGLGTPVRAEVGIDVVRLVAEPWTYRLLTVGGEVSTDEGASAKVGASMEKEVPDKGGFGGSLSVEGGYGAKGPSGEAAGKLTYSPMKKGEPVRLEIFGEIKGSVARDGSEIKGEGTATFGVGGKF